MSSDGPPPDERGACRPHVVAVCGSRRSGSYTRRALVEALSAVEAAGGTGELLDLGEVELAPLAPDGVETGDAADVSRRIREADAVILGTPTYHGSYSGVLKNAIDHCGFDELEGTIVGLLAVSGGPFPTTALDHLRAVCRALHAWVLPHQAAVPHASQAFDDGDFADHAVRDRVRTLGTKVVSSASPESRPAVAIPRQEA